MWRLVWWWRLCSGVCPRSGDWDIDVLGPLLSLAFSFLHERPRNWSLPVLEAVVDVGRLHLGVLPVVGGLRRELSEGLHHVQEDAGAVEALDDVLAEVAGPVLLVSRDEELHGVVLNVGRGHYLHGQRLGKKYCN